MTLAAGGEHPASNNTAVGGTIGVDRPRDEEQRHPLRTRDEVPPLDNLSAHPNQFRRRRRHAQHAGGVARCWIYGRRLVRWHKSIGLIALGAALLRSPWRQSTALPDWAPNLSDGEKRAIHRIERTRMAA